MKELKNKVELVLGVDDIPQSETHQQAGWIKNWQKQVTQESSKQCLAQSCKIRHLLDNIWMTEFFEK